MSVFAEPRRIIDKDEAVELITAVLPDVDAKELRERLSSKKGFVWIKRQVTPRSSRRSSISACPASASCPRTSASIPTGPSARMCSASSTRTISASPAWRNISTSRASPIRTSPASASIRRAEAGAAFARSEGDARAARRTRGRHGQVQAKAAAGAIIDVNTGEIIALESLPDFDPNDPPDMTKDPTTHQPRQRRRLRDGLDLQGADDRDGARIGQGHARLAHRRARQPALRALHHPRFPRHAPRADRARGVHPFLQHRHRAHGADGRRRGPSGVPAEDGPARPAAHRTAGKRRAARSQALGRTQHDDDRLRPGPQCRAAAGADGGRGAGQRRPSDDADLPGAQRGAGDGRQPSRGRARRPPNRCAI